MLKPTVSRHDLIILGGGPAGMSAALVAGRALLQTVIVNAESPRNAVTAASHGFLTRDGVHPNELLALAKAQLTPYRSVRYIRGRATAVSRTEADVESDIRVELADGSAHVAPRLIVATGQRDELARLSLPGIENVYGKSVFPCPFCDGFEHRAEKLAIFGGDHVEHFVPVVRMWSRDLVVFTNGRALSEEALHAFEVRAIPVHTDSVTQLHPEGGRLTAVELATGHHVVRDAGFIADDYSHPATDFADILGVERAKNPWGMPTSAADDNGSTAVPGVYVIGDSRTGFGGLMTAANDGATCAAAIVHELASSRWSSLAS